MHSLRTRITLLTICMVAISVIIVTLVSVHFIRKNARLESDQLLLLLCETGERNLDYYFDSVQKSVERVADYAEKDLDGMDSIDHRRLQAHVERVADYFDEIANKTNGVLTYYYRIDPAVSDSVKGFWYTDLDRKGFVGHEVTDITLYDTQDTTKLVWFTVPKHEGEAIWLPPYVTDNLDIRVISYNVPIYLRGQFIGVAGIELDYSEMAEQVESIRLYSNGYAFLSDETGKLFYHPRINVAGINDETIPTVPEGFLSSSTFVRYTFEGIERQAAWLPLSNGMRLNVTIPVSETEGNWQRLVTEVILISGVVLLACSLFTLYDSRRITKPLEDLTKAAIQADEGNYTFELDYNGDDEVGRLTNSFKHMAGHMKEHINDLNKRVYVDALTSVKNKGAFSSAIEKLQSQVDESEEPTAFAVGVFDCDDLKTMNDRYGHDKGDIYLKTSCRLICRVFQHSPVFRIGGDEFAVILQNDDYQNRDELVLQFEKAAEETSALTDKIWEQVHISMGLAVYDPRIDPTVIDTVHRADKCMYGNKHAQKEARAATK